MEKKKTEQDYRAKRKARIAKSSAKSKKVGVDSYKVAKAVISVICVALVIAAAVGICFAYGVPQRMLPAVTVGDRTYSVAEYEYYYTSLYGSQAQSSAQMAEQYGSAALLAALGQFDHTVHPEKQTTKLDDESTVTWAEYFDKSIVDMFQSYEYYFAQCKELGIELDDDDHAEIDELIESVKTYADTYSVSVTRYLGSYYGNGMTMKLYRNILEDQKLAEKYIAHIEAENEAAITDEAIEEAYNADPSAYQVIDLRVFGISTDGSSVTADNAENETSSDVDTEALKADALKKAEEFCGKITDEQSFIDLSVEYAAESDKEAFKNESATVANQISKSVVAANISEELSEWLFEEGRAHGDKYFVESNDGDFVYVVFVVRPAYREDAPKVDVRHILVSYETGVNHMKAHETDGTEHNEAAIFAAEADKAAEEFGLTVDYDFAAAQNSAYTKDVVDATYSATYDIYESYRENATEENFAELANNYSADTSSTTASETGDGGLYEDIAKGSMVDNFDAWIYDANRVAGDVGIVQTEYGFHIIYFVERNERADWEDTVVESLASETTEAFNAKMEEILADDSNVKESAFKNYAYNTSIDLIEKVYGGNYFELD